jgi:hypothetical protein
MNGAVPGHPGCALTPARYDLSLVGCISFTDLGDTDMTIAAPAGRRATA